MPGAIALIITGWDIAPWVARFRALAPDRDIRVWPEEIGNTQDIAYACVWKPPHGALATLKNLQAIFCLGAGVDHLMQDPAIPNLPVVRTVDADLTAQMTEYIVMHTLIYHRKQRAYDAQQRQKIWRELDQPSASRINVGIMGLGELGTDAASVLRRIGFNVAGWTRTTRHADGIELFHGTSGLDPFLARTEILVSLLPHTPATEGILNLGLFRKLKRDGALGGAYLINAGRGKLQIDADICSALDQGILAGATLDVFPAEPLPAESPLWRHPKVTITPHNAAVSDPDVLAKGVLDQIANYEAGRALENVVDRKVGY
ncbi:MAG TPA: glyoxylate/hydroxypyruvate reductase A [Xanthobacteraceae bacterium]|nr:glyoxylate/hydroxypyruvate reductase A [Xanthobacteraceae bacterium]